MDLHVKRAEMQKLLEMHKEQIAAISGYMQCLDDQLAELTPGADAPKKEEN